MNKYFTKSGVRKVGITLEDSFIEKLKNHWQTYLKSVDDFPNIYDGKGIVICAGGFKYFTCAIVLITRLRALGCKLPIEVFYSGNEMTPNMIKRLEHFEVTVTDINKTFTVSKGFMIKALAILHSRFKEVLYLDADVIPTKDVTYLFYDPNYLKHHAIFWPDYWRTEESNPIWKIFSTCYTTKPEQESGQILINKEFCWKPLNLCVYMNITKSMYYKLLYGDKDTFRFAWLALDYSFYMIKDDPGCLGRVIEGKFSSCTIVQFDMLGHILFLHRNLLKWDITNEDEYCWQIFKRFIKNARKKSYHLNTYETGKVTMDIAGDVEESDCPEYIKIVEQDCLTVLKNFRRSELFIEVLENDSIINEIN